jgi:ADP-ribosylglycohydrolase
MIKFFYIVLCLINCCNTFAQQPNDWKDSNFIRNKIKGLITGTLLGDALGGPIEFQGHPEIQATPNPPKFWTDTNDVINGAALKAAAERIYFREYKYLRPVPEPYGHWGTNSAPGTVTDDSRHKIILMHFLRNALQKKQWPVADKNLAQGYLDWSKSKTIKTHSGYDTLCPQWLDESYKAINWLKGSREPGKAYPLERLWNALPTCYGQMSLPPMAALYPGEPEKAYLATYHLAWFENGFAKDMIAALVAGLSVGLTLDPATMTNEQLWTRVIDTMKSTDPYAYTKVPWSERAVDRWLNLADQFVKEANGSPAKLFALLENEFMYTTKWEAQVPFVVIFSAIKICKYDPMAALQLSIEWGWDHDSYAQLLGAFVGAIYGPQIFEEDMRTTVTKRLQLDYDESIDEWVNTLMKIQQLGKTKELFTNGK